MPGYTALPSFMTGDTADQVREADARQRTGDSALAVQLLEEALAVSIGARTRYDARLSRRARAAGR